MADFLFPGLIRIYNRLPYPVKFQWDSREYQLPPHVSSVVPREVALAAVKAGVYKITREGEYKYGVVVEGFGEFSPLPDTEVPNKHDPIASYPIEFENPQEMVQIRVPLQDVPLRYHRPVDAAILVLPGRGD